MNEKILVQALWVGKELSNLEKLSINSFLKNGHDYYLYVYDEIEAPEGTIIKDANEILPKESIFREKELNSPINFSDLFRYKLLMDKGGIWVDTDVVCLRHFDFDTDYVFGQERVDKDEGKLKKYGKSWINGCVLKSKKNSEFIKYCYNTCLERMPGEVAWEMGPPILTEAVKKFEIDKYVRSYRAFNPVHWWEFEHLTSGKLTIMIKMYFKFLFRTYSIHFWDSMWKRANIDKNSVFSSNSLYERLKRKYL
jgi:mannosyltransferase OCH1-like enzyme